MVSGDATFSGSIPELYDRLLVPLLFEAYAHDLADRVRKWQPKDVLETAAGTGALTRALARALPASRIIATDLNEAMLRQAAARGGSDNVHWEQADAAELPFEDGAFDVVACQFGIMFLPDRIKGYKEARRVLREDGRFLFSLWDEIGANDFAATVTDALAELYPTDPPRFLARTPHGHSDTELTRGELTAAGFDDISVERVEHRSRAEVPSIAAVGYCHGTPLRGEIEARGSLDEATERAVEALRRRFGDGPIDGRIAAYVFAASR